MKHTNKIKWILISLAIIYIINGLHTSYVRAMAFKEDERLKMAQAEEKARIEAMTVPELIEHVSEPYNVNTDILKRVAWCESSYRYNVYGDGGKAYGIYQFHKPTFDHFSKKLGEELNYYSSYDQAKLAAYMFENGKQSHWTCYNKIAQK